VSRPQTHTLSPTVWVCKHAQASIDEQRKADEPHAALFLALLGGALKTERFRFAFKARFSPGASHDGLPVARCRPPPRAPAPSASRTPTRPQLARRPNTKRTRASRAGEGKRNPFRLRPGPSPAETSPDVEPPMVDGDKPYVDGQHPAKRRRKSAVRGAPTTRAVEGTGGRVAAPPPCPSRARPRRHGRGRAGG